MNKSIYKPGTCEIGVEIIKQRKIIIQKLRRMVTKHAHTCSTITETAYTVTVKGRVWELRYFWVVPSVSK